MFTAQILEICTKYNITEVIKKNNHVLYIANKRVLEEDVNEDDRG